MNEQTLVNRTTFYAAQTSEILQPLILPVTYEWLREGFYAVYNGFLAYGGQPESDTWGWEINHVSGETREGRKSCLKYTRYHGKNNKYGDMGGGLMDWGTIFPCFFRIQNRLPDEQCSTEVGIFECFKASRPPQGRTALNRIMWYDKRTSVLIKIEARTLAGQLVLACSLSDTIEPLLSSRISTAVDQELLPQANFTKEYSESLDVPWWKKLPLRRLEG